MVSMSNAGPNEILGLLGDLDQSARAGDLAARASYSKPQFGRIVKRGLGAPPMTVRRRMLLERAAHRLTQTGQSITEIAFDAGFGSLEGFGRAFRSAFRISPSRYRKLKPDEYRIDLSSAVHYAPSDAPRKGEKPMNVIELMTEHHSWEMLRFIEA